MIERLIEPGALADNMSHVQRRCVLGESMSTGLITSLQ